MSHQEVDLFFFYPVFQTIHLFSETLLIWASTTLYGHPLLQNRFFKFSRYFWKVNGNERSLLIRSP